MPEPVFSILPTLVLSAPHSPLSALHLTNPQYWLLTKNTTSTSVLMLSNTSGINSLPQLKHNSLIWACLKIFTSFPDELLSCKFPIIALYLIVHPKILCPQCSVTFYTSPPPALIFPASSLSQCFILYLCSIWPQLSVTKDPQLTYCRTAELRDIFAPFMTVADHHLEYRYAIADHVKL